MLFFNIVFRQIIVILFLIMTGFSAFGERRALIIGNNAYKNVSSLTNPVNDVDALTKFFSQINYKINSIKNVNYEEFTNAVIEFSNTVQQGDEVVFHFSGHGLAVDGNNFLLPTDMIFLNLNNLEMLPHRSWNAVKILEILSKRKPKWLVMILDACRDNPFSDEKSKSRGFGLGRGLAPMTVPPGVFVVYSAGFGEKALDSLRQDSKPTTSVFIRNFLKYAVVPGLHIEEIVKKTRIDVFNMAKMDDHTQLLAYYNGSLENIILIPSEKVQIIEENAPEAEYRALIKNPTEQAILKFMLEYPLDSRITNIQKFYDQIVEDRKFAEIKNKKNIKESIDEFKLRYPQSRHLKEADSIVENLEGPSLGWVYYGHRRFGEWKGRFFNNKNEEIDSEPVLGNVVTALGSVNIRKTPPKFQIIPLGWQNAPEIGVIQAKQEFQVDEVADVAFGHLWIRISKRQK